MSSPTSDGLTRRTMEPCRRPPVRWVMRRGWSAVAIISDVLAILFIGNSFRQRAAPRTAEALSLRRHAIAWRRAIAWRLAMRPASLFRAVRAQPADLRQRQSPDW